MRDISKSFPHREQAAETNGEPQPKSVQPVFDYFQLTSTALVIDKPTASAVASKFGLQATRLITYLANSIAKIDPAVANLNERASPRRFQNLDTEERTEDRRSARRSNQPSPTLQVFDFHGDDSSKYEDQPPASLLSREVPYSLIVGVDEDNELRLAEYTELAAEDLRLPFCWINSWLAEQLAAKAGDWIQIKYFEPETVDGTEVERSDAFMIAGVVPLTEPKVGFRRDQPAQYAEPPTVFNDPDLTPKRSGLDRQRLDFELGRRRSSSGTKLFCQSTTHTIKTIA